MVGVVQRCFFALCSCQARRYRAERPCVIGWRKRPDGSTFFRPDEVVGNLSEAEIQSRLERNKRDIPANRCDKEYLDRQLESFIRLGKDTQGGDPESLIKFKEWLITSPLEFGAPNWSSRTFVINLSRSLGYSFG
jgi:hypothetical protein